MTYMTWVFGVVSKTKRQCGGVQGDCMTYMTWVLGVVSKTKRHCGGVQGTT